MTKTFSFREGEAEQLSEAKNHKLSKKEECLRNYVVVVIVVQRVEKIVKLQQSSNPQGIFCCLTENILQCSLEELLNQRNFSIVPITFEGSSSFFVWSHCRNREWLLFLEHCFEGFYSRYFRVGTLQVEKESWVMYCKCTYMIGPLQDQQPPFLKIWCKIFAA